MTKTAMLLVNKRARNGAGRIDDVIELLRNGGMEVIEPHVNEQDSFADVIRRNADTCDLVIVGGGDGTMNTAAPGLADTKLPFGILPLGTANDLARTLGLPASPLEAAKVILGGVTRELDLGDVNGHLYFNVASIGFSAELARILTSEAKKRWGKLGYGVAASRLLAQSRPFTAFIEHDGIIEQARTLQISVGNGRFYGGGMTVETSAQPDDGRLDVYSLEISHWAELIALLPALRRGTQGRWKNVRAFSTTGLTVRTRRSHAVNADGEIVTRTPATFKIRRRAVTVFVSEGSE
ncbi:lipid kinase [Rhodoligotrophos appendicifer]|uniref:lipid kinase n=1 Tax=Rhodoligotrophos appendicifer TaxID=987056 RepID=UPI003D1991BD